MSNIFFVFFLCDLVANIGVYMDKIIIKGGKKLSGIVRISGAKNAALPIMASSLLVEGRTVLTNVPNLIDIRTMSHLLRIIGAKVEYEPDAHILNIDTSNCSFWEAPYELVKTMRASTYVMGPLLGRFGKANVSFPGGCAIGQRPIDLHLKGFRKLGANIRIERGYILAEAKELIGNHIYFDKSSVGATANVMMAAVKAQGTTILENSACEPEVTALAEFLTKMGAKISGIGTSKLIIQGVKALKPITAEIIPDRIEAGTFLIAGAITNSELTIIDCEPKHLSSVIEKLRECGYKLGIGENNITITTNKQQPTTKPLMVSTAPYPDFPTDLQAQLTALLSIGQGESIIKDNIFPERFMHISELNRLGANIKVKDNIAYVKGVEKLIGAPVMATDLRASAALILAGLAAEGETEISRIYHLDRGYEKIEQKLSKLGADIKRIY